MSYPAIFSKKKINTMTLQSRVLMGSMHLGLEGVEGGTDKLIAFYSRRASEHIGLIVTGGVAVNAEGAGGSSFMKIYRDEDVEDLKRLTAAVHEKGGKIALQLFHAGRYAYKAETGIQPVAPSAIRSPINPDTPRALSSDEVLETIKAFGEGAKRAKEAGFDAVEIMGSEGYLINQFISPVTNQRDDDWGGSFEKRIRFPLAVVNSVREAVGSDYPVIFRISGLDLIDNSTTEEETLILAKELETAGVDALNVGIGWHESQVPTISMKVPRGYFVPVATKMKEVVSIPVIASNRINNPNDAEDILREGKADFVSMARPFLADPELLTKAKEGRVEEINTCIACNQACLDHIFSGQFASCLVNPEAGRELELTLNPASKKKKIFVIGAGPAGLEASRTAAKRGHEVTLIDEKADIGGQLNYARIVPLKQEFNETIRYYTVMLKKLGVNLQLNRRIEADDPILQEADEIIIATGIVPRTPDFPGVQQENVLSYREVFEGKLPEGKEIVIIGGGGIACDLSFFLMSKGDYSITLLQRSKAFARGIGKTTRWATLMELYQKGVKMLGEIQYKKIEGNDIYLEKDGEEIKLSADTFILASGQLPNNSLYEQLKERYPHVHIIGGAKLASELDAKRAIYEGTIVGRSV
ncbi:MAG TPA: FAD-dependent oxidoreductase [Bacilli bacterium]|nr:FAD-dependent oxidoreductase [Bacilli bacterium]